MDRSWEQPTSTLSAKWAPCGAEVQELSRDHPPSQSDGQIPSLLHHVKITGNPILEGVSWDFATEMDLPLRSGLPCCPSLWIHCWHGSFPPETKLSTVYIHFISVYITASIFLYSKGPFMVKKIYIWFPINNQSYHVLEGKKLLEGNVCRKVQLRASAVFFFPNKSALFLHPYYNKLRRISEHSGTTNPFSAWACCGNGLSFSKLPSGFSWSSIRGAAD